MKDSALYSHFNHCIFTVDICKEDICGLKTNVQQIVSL